MIAILGARIRELRKKLKFTQAQLAHQVGISPSYLNLIEHNKRTISGALLRKIATSLDVKIEELDGAVERRLLSTLEEIAYAPDIAALGVETERIGELIGRYPGWARTVASLARSEHEATQVARALGDRLTHDAFLGDAVHSILSGISAIRSVAEILVEHNDIDAATLDKFHHIIHNECRKLTDVGEALAAYFSKADVTEHVLTPLDEVEAFFESRSNRIDELEKAADSLATEVNDTTPGSRYANAYSLARTKLADCVSEIISRHRQFDTEFAQHQAHEALLAYAARALLAPDNIFQTQAQQVGFDVEALADTFSINFETVCHRLCALPDNGSLPRFGYFLANAAGTIVTLRTLPGLVSPRYASACPLWALFRAQQSPQTVMRQRTVFPTGTRIVFLARARHAGATGFGKPRHYVTDMLATSEQDASLTVYAPDDAVPVEPVGSTCRSCPRRECAHRVSDPLTG